MNIQDHTYSVDSEIADTKIGRPHVIIIGAGASRAAFPNGDAHGAKLPLMNDLIDILELRSELDKHTIDTNENNFELIYNKILEKNLEDLRALVEIRVHDYFAKLRLPDFPTIYDYLVMSLRKKDLIATFNWDPFLYLACCRNHKRNDNLPNIAYLHGSVVVGYCLKCMKKGHVYSKCSKCGELFTPSKLLFPIKEKITVKTIL